jgi:hypothetical protein
MKLNRFLAVPFALAIAFLAGCGDDEKAPSFLTQPEARAENDNSGKGIYKGVLIGSSGHLKVDIDNSGDGSISLTLTLDDVRYNLTTEQRYNPEVGFQGYFRGTVNGGEAQIGYFTNANGTSYGFFGVEIPGHPDVVFLIFKEKSTAVLRLYEGTFSGSTSGTVNLVLFGNEWHAVTRPQGGTSEDVDFLDGEIDGNTLVCACDFTFTGTINGNNLSGTWADGEESGTWTASRSY